MVDNFATRKRIVVASLVWASKLVNDILRDFKSEYSTESPVQSLKNPLTYDTIADAVSVSVAFVKKVSKYHLMIFDPEYSFLRVPGGGPKRKLDSPEALHILEESSNKRFRSNSVVKRELARKGIADVHVSTVNRERHRQGFVPFKPFRVLLFRAATIALRNELDVYCLEWPLCQWKRLSFADEFYVWASRRPNAQNHRVWARSRQEVADILATPALAHPICVGIFLLFTAKNMVWVVKEQGDSWTGNYFRKKIIEPVVIPFFDNQANLEGPCGGTLLWHDNAPGWRAKETVELLDEGKVPCFNPSGKRRVPPYSADLNLAENMGAILMESVEEILDEHDIAYTIKGPRLVAEIERVLKGLAADKQLLSRMISAFKPRMALLHAAKGQRLKELS